MPDIAKYAADPMVFFCDMLLRPDGPRFGDVWTPEQRDFLATAAPCLLAIAQRRRPPRRGVWAEAVKGWGKDSLGALCIVWLLAFSPWAVLIQVAADDQGQGGEVKRAIQDWLAANGWLGERLEVQRWRIVNAATGGECEILTTDSTGSHGARPNMILLNEVSHIGNDTFAQTILDNFAKMPDAFGLLCTNAGFVQSWAWKWREIYRQDERWHFIKVTATPPWQSPADIQEARKRNPPARFRRLYQGEWVAAGGDSLPADAIERCIVHAGPQWNRVQFVDTICGIGVDAGLVTHHAAVVVLTGNHQSGTLRVARVVDLPPPCRLDRIRDEIISQGNMFCTRAVFCDSWEMLRVCEELVGMGFDVTAERATGNVLVRQAAALQQAFRDEVLELYPDPLLMEDLYGARVVERPYGSKIELAENENGHSDRLAALLTVLPHMLAALGQPYMGDITDGLGDRLPIEVY